MVLKGKNILLGICGGIAAYKMPMVIRLLKKEGAHVRVVMTRSATRFVTELTLSTVSQEPVNIDIFPDSYDTEHDWTRHISLGEWADLMIIAPATANTIAKITAGICDDLLSTCFITLRPDRPKLIFPAMDGEMYHSGSVQRNLAWLRDNGCKIIEPESGSLASGQCGTGRMPEPEAIVASMTEAIGESRHSTVLQHKNIIVTAGPTREKIDGVRFVSNYSSGKMGFAIACAAARRGADVTLISGPVSLPSPERVRRIDVETACDMEREVQRIAPQCDIFIAAAAVADYRPAEPVAGKIKKHSNTLELSLIRNPDILAGFSINKKPHQLSVGFALETENGLAYAEQKLRAKNLDLIACNTYDRTTSGFEVDTNILTLIDKQGTISRLPLLTKKEAAIRLIDAIEAMLSEQQQG